MERVTDFITDVGSFVAQYGLSWKSVALGGLLAVWHVIAGAKAKGIEQRVREAARVAFVAMTALLDAGVISPERFAPAVMSRATWLLNRLHIPMRDQILALLQHELDVMTVELAAPRIAAAFAKIPSVEDLRAGFASAKAAGLAKGRELPITWEQVDDEEIARLKAAGMWDRGIFTTDAAPPPEGK